MSEKNVPDSHEYVEGGGTFTEQVIAAQGVDLDTLDPDRIAPTIVVDNETRMSDPGHGKWHTPLIGGTRPYVYEVVFNNRAKRAFADTLVGAVGVLIPGYADLTVTAMQVADEHGPDSDEASNARVALHNARVEYLSTVRQSLQKAANARARQTGAWDRLDAEEVEQVTLAETATPVGVMCRMGDENGPEYGFWETRAVPLFLNLGEYGEYGDDTLPKTPISDAGEKGDDGRVHVPQVRWPENTPILDPTDDDSMVESLQRVGVIDLIERPVLLPDSIFVDALTEGAAMRAGENAQQ